MAEPTRDRPGEPDPAPVVAPSSPATVPSPRGMPERGRRWIAGWGGLAVALVAATFVADPPTVAVLQAVGMPLLAVLGFGALNLAGSAVQVTVGAGGQRSVTLIEATVIATIMLLPRPWAILAVVVGIALSQMFVLRLPAYKVAFNVSMFAVATTAASTVFHLLRFGSDPLSWIGILATLPAMLVFGMINIGAMEGLFNRIERRRRPRTGARAPRRIEQLSLLGSTAIGVLGAVLLSSRPWLTPLLAFPILSQHLAHSGLTRTATLLRRSENERERLDRLITGATDGVVLLNETGQVEVWSPAMTRLTAIEAEDARGRRMPELLESIAGALPDLLENQAAVLELDLTLTPEDRSERVVQLSRSLLTEEGELTGAVIVVRDVTREREVERLKDDFLMRVSHELRTPLTPIKGFAESLRMHKDKVTPEMLEIGLGRISDRADHMTDLIDDLLLVASVRDQRAAAPPLAPEPTDAVAVVEMVLAAAGTQHPTRVLRLRSSDQVVALVDPGRLRQIVNELVDNAMRYSPDGTPVEVHVTQGGDVAVIDVVDHGRGIPADHLDRIFERFHRVEDPLLMTTGGIGVGLYLARVLTESMGGTLDVRSTIGKGSVFTLSIPLAHADRTESRSTSR